MVADLRRYCGPIRDQGQEGSCTGQAAAANRDWWARYLLQHLPDNNFPVFSAQDVYANELILDGNFPNDDGSTGHSACWVTVKKGICQQATYQYVAGDIQLPTTAQVADALVWRLDGYHRLSGSADVIRLVGHPTHPMPVLAGFDVFSSFETKTGTTGVYDPNKILESLLGGHETLIVGADLDETQTLRPAGCPPAFLVQNSWGTGWGWNRDVFFWMAQSVVDDPQTDLMIVHPKMT